MPSAEHVAIVGGGFSATLLAINLLRHGEALQQWFEEGAADGFVIFEPLPGQLALFVEGVVPILQPRGLFREEYDGTTFRAHLGSGAGDRARSHVNTQRVKETNYSGH